jgi:putative ABC transport system permease protein
MKPSELQATDPPFRVAWGQAIASIRVRFWRHSLTALGIALGTAFFASMLTLVAAERSTAAPDTESAARLTWLAYTSLLMCLAGVTNSMLLSVTERYREIGTIKCIGASDGFIVKVFFLEAALLGIIGSLAGGISGSLLMAIAALSMGFEAPWTSLPSNVGGAVAAGALLTVLSAIFPAIQAARMPAAAALRVEI